MKCPNCKKHIFPLKIGATIGAAQLKACPECGVVFIELPPKEGNHGIDYLPYGVEVETKDGGIP